VIDNLLFIYDDEVVKINLSNTESLCNINFQSDLDKKNFMKCIRGNTTNFGCIECGTEKWFNKKPSLVFDENFSIKLII
jgi:hypothetical protein